MIMKIEEARDTLRLSGVDNDIIILPLLEAIPPYLETTTGKSWDKEPIQPLAKQAAKFILIKWFDGTEAYDKTIDGLLTALTAMGRNING
ncbi:phage gp6-like head-tail connector protein [Clostridium sporogenes]